MSAPTSPHTERSPLLAPSSSSPSSASPARPSYRQRALSRASGNPLPLVNGNGGPDSPTLSSNGHGDLPYFNANDPDNLSKRKLLFRRLIFALLAFLLLAGIVLSIVLPLTIGRHGGGGGKGNKGQDKPDYTKLPPPNQGGGERNPAYMVSGYQGAVASEEGRCSQIGVDVLRENGTAVDAAIATALCIGVLNSFSSGIGGGGFMVIRPPSLTTHSSSSALPHAYSISNVNCTAPISIDFREAAPAVSFPFMFTPTSNLSHLFPLGDPALASKIGGLAVAVPGELRGFEAAYQTCGGGVPWSRLFEPAAELAREFEVGKELNRRLSGRFFPQGPRGGEWMKEIQEEVYGDWRGVFMKEGGQEFRTFGDVVHRTEYADTLAAMGVHGADAFYKGEIAKALVETVRAAGGVVTLEDFAKYRAVVRKAEVGEYGGRKYYTGSYPGGGPVLRLLLNVLDGYKGYGEERTGLGVHRFVEALKFAFAARTEVGDPDFIDNAAKLKQIPTRKYADEVRRNITDDRTHPLPYYHPRFDIHTDHGTTHLSVIDRWGGAVSLTTTVNLVFGSRVMDRKTGIILNDEMDDFATPGVPDAFGLAPSPFNYPSPHKRPLSSTSPIIMDHPHSSSSKDSSVWLAMGGSGGSRIFGAVAQTLLNLDWRMDLSNAVEQPRVHHQLLPDYVSVESSYRPDLLDEMRDRGHNLTVFDINVGIAEVQAVVRDEKGKFFAASDSRKNGVPAAF
ncbi:hypothetical protein JCM11641_002057 [Rhodosporidiobolus odoratus]